MKGTYHKIILYTAIFIGLAGIGAVIVLANAPGFILIGGKGVHLDYGDSMRVAGWYESPWRLRFSAIYLYSPDDDQPIAQDYPLAIEVGGRSYAVGAVTPEIILELGGNIYESTDGYLNGTLRIQDYAVSVEHHSMIWTFDNGSVKSWKLHISRWLPELDGWRVSYEGQTMLRFPASERDVTEAFGEPSARYEWSGT